MSTLLMNSFQLGAWAIAIAGGLVTAWKAIREMRRSNVQRGEDLAQRRIDMRWKRAQMAKTCLDELFGNPLAGAALKMLDWNGLSYKRPDGRETGAITHSVRRTALRVSGTIFDPAGDEGFIRDAYDALFDSFERLEHFIEIELIVFDDVRPSLNYFVGKLSNTVNHSAMQAYLKAYEFSAAAAFLYRFPIWRESGSVQHRPDPSLAP